MDTYEDLSEDELRLLLIYLSVRQRMSTNVDQQIIYKKKIEYINNLLAK